MGFDNRKTKWDADESWDSDKNVITVVEKTKNPINPPINIMIRVHTSLSY